ncbi:iron complex transport system substrate-binding protein [Actinocorallia herbida]|uniref:Iron complex transport system substrate-binding protein n=1 Tax=Actinocorallia herbida TaxID=58109 RepID=A0A3N1CSW1_9ACTN|nr:ABC transporter substrate-binding protein [Actinocorallia herbida]ROO84407.1 iron complex transport system substrate-binding protein [Actinocorallia herbida]
MTAPRARRWGTAALALALVAGCGGRPAAEHAQGTAAADGCGPATVTGLPEDVDPLAPAPKPRLPVTVTGADGEKTTVTDTSRILALNMYGSLAEIVFSLGLGDHVVGRDASTTFASAKDLPLVTTHGHDLSAEAILGLDPTVVLADASIGPAEAITQIREAGIPVVMVDDAQTLPAVTEHIADVAAALGVADAGERLSARVTDGIAEARRSAPEGAQPTIAFLYVRGTAGVYLIGGDGAGSDAMIEAIGARDAGTAIGLEGFRPLTSEGLINAAPDAILVMSSGLESVGGVDGLLKLPGVAQTPAGEHRRVIDADDGSLLNFGARTGDTIAALAHAVYGTCAS